MSLRIPLVVPAAAISFAAAMTLNLGARSPQAIPTPVNPQITDVVLKGYQWRSIGPDRGGRSIAVSGVKGRPKEAYFGATGGGLWKTTDGGDTWRPVTDGQLTSASVGAVAVSESNPDVVYIGMGESCIRGNIMPGDGVYKSTDAGKTWTHVGFGNGTVDAISKIRIHPANPDIAYAAVFGKYGLNSAERGVFKTTDGGKTWRKVLFRDDKTGAADIALDRRNPDVLFAALWEAYRVEYQMSSGGPGSGLFKSTDGGEHWTEITRNPGLPSGVVGRIGVAISGADSSRVYALVENEHGGLYSSDDAGATWKLVNENRSVRQRAFYYTHVIADTGAKDTVYMLNTSAFRSTDGGKTLTNVGGGTHGDHHDLWVDPDDPKHLVIANDGGGAVSAEAGRGWTAQDFPTAQYYHVISTAHVPYHVCGAQQDGSTVCLPMNAGQGGFGRGGGGGGRGAAPDMYSPGGAEPGYVAPDPRDVDVFYAGGNNGSLLTRLDRRTGNLREVNPYPRMFSGEASSDVVERWQWTYPIVFSPADPSVLYTSSQHVWRTRNGGDSWEKISGDLTRHDPKTMGPSGGPITHDMNSPEIYGTVFALGPGKKDVNILWAGSDDGLVQVTRDGGKSWANVTPKEMPDLGRVSIIDASAFEPGAAYVAVKKPLLGDFSPYIFRTHDFGRTWTKIVTGIRADDYVHAVREDPVRRGLLYAGTQHGFYISYDDGNRWQPFSLNLPDVPIADVWVEANSIAIATHGRSFYVLDDLAPLRQLGQETAGAGFYLYKPADAIRGSGGAAIPYLLDKTPEKLTVEILDSKGVVVQTIQGRGAAGSARGARGAQGARGARGLRGCKLRQVRQVRQVRTMRLGLKRGRNVANGLQKRPAEVPAWADVAAGKRRMTRLIVLTGSLAMVIACSNPSASASNNLASGSAAEPRTAPAAAGDTSAAADKTVAAAPARPVAAAAEPVATSGASAAAVREVTLPAGTVLPVDLETSVGSDISRVEQPVQARLRRAVTIDGVQVLPAGTAVTGYVTAAQRPGRVKGRGYVAMRFTAIDTPGAGATRISSATIGRTAPATKKKDAVKIGAPAAAGAVIGGIVGGGDGAAKGAVIGGAAGTGYVLSTRGKDVRIGKGADLAVRLTAPVTLRVRS